MRELTATTCWVVLALQWTAVACSNHDLHWKDTNAPPASFEGDAGEVGGKPGIGGGAATSGEGAGAGAGAGELGGSASGGALSSEGSQGGAGMKGEGGAADMIPTEKPENSAGGEAAAGAGGVDGTEGCAPGCCPVSAANAAESAQVPLADSRQGFSSTQGQCGWSYGYLPSGKEPLRLLSHFAASEALWEASTEWPPWSAIYRDQQHPNQVPLHWIVRRWTSHVHGPIWIRGRVAKRDVSGGDGIAAQVRVDSQVVWEATVAFDDDVGVSFEVEATVAVGSAVDFIVSPKAGDAHDLTELFASITR